MFMFARVQVLTCEPASAARVVQKNRLPHMVVEL